MSAQAGLTKEQRWGMLELIVDEGILKVIEIRSHLNWLIRKNQNNHNFDYAIPKWKMDSDHMAGYNSNDESIVEVGGIISNNYRR